MNSRAQVILLLFTLIVMAHNLRVPATYLYYYTATEDFIERLCENKDRPELNCDGKCYLAKMLQESGDDADPLPKEQLSWPENLVFLPYSTQVDLSWDTEEAKGSFFYGERYALILTKSFFHPPNTLS